MVIVVEFIINNDFNLVKDVVIRFIFIRIFIYLSLFDLIIKIDKKKSFSYNDIQNIHCFVDSIFRSVCAFVE